MPKIKEREPKPVKAAKPVKKLKRGTMAPAGHFTFRGKKFPIRVEVL